MRDFYLVNPFLFDDRDIDTVLFVNFRGREGRRRKDVGVDVGKYRILAMVRYNWILMSF
jgi:hypothetical protein